MKRFLIALLALLLLTSSALACETWQVGDWLKVVNCEEHISLRSAPSVDAEAFDFIPLGASTLLNLGPFDDTFTAVLYEGRAGYVMSKYLKNQFIVCQGCEDVDLSDAERYNLNIFLSNFTEQGMLQPVELFQGDAALDYQLVNFAIEHIWYNRQDYLEWGDYADGNNVRLNSKYIPAVCEKYFGRAPENLASYVYTLNDGYYYWQETGGHAPCGFALQYDAADMGGGRYRVNFLVYGMGMEHDESVYSMDERSLFHKMPEYFNGPISPYSNTNVYPSGNAIINVNGGSLADRSTWTLERLFIDWTV